MFEHRSQLRFSDSDAMGHVNHARFATIFEDARIALLRSLGPPGTDLTARGVILARLEIDYVRPLEVRDEAVVTAARVVRVGTSSFAIDYTLRQDGAICARGVSVLVAYDYGAARSRPLSDDERARLEAARDSAADG